MAMSKKTLLRAAMSAMSGGSGRGCGGSGLVDRKSSAITDESEVRAVGGDKWYVL